MQCSERFFPALTFRSKGADLRRPFRHVQTLRRVAINDQAGEWMTKPVATMDCDYEGACRLFGIFTMRLSRNFRSPRSSGPTPDDARLGCLLSCRHSIPFDPFSSFVLSGGDGDVNDLPPIWSHLELVVLVSWDGTPCPFYGVHNLPT